MQNEPTAIWAIWPPEPSPHESAAAPQKRTRMRKCKTKPSESRQLHPTTTTLNFPMDLFGDIKKKNLQRVAPLAVRMRPRSLDEFVGQRHFLGPGKLLR